MQKLKLWTLSVLLFLGSCTPTKEIVTEDVATPAPEAAIPELPINVANYVEAHYNKAEYHIKMRDGVMLYTAVYSPKDTSETYPILMKRTPYSCRPYGANQFPKSLGPSKFLMEDKYIFVYQDVRGRWMSDGLYDNMRPHIANKQSNEDIDESSDTYDTIEWLLNNIKNHNGNVGQWGISYPGFYTTAGAVDAHPALKASSPQAPIADFYFDDFHHQGAYLLSYFRATTVFGYQKDKRTTESWYPTLDLGTPDQYKFFLEMGPLQNGDKYFGADNFFWQQLKNHPDYDEFWQQRSIIPHLNNINHAVMTVGGWFDAEDLYGPLNTYKTIEKNNPTTNNTIVMGPWSHGDWSRERGQQYVGNIYFGDSISTHYQKHIERNFFTFYLKGAETAAIPEAYLFDTGKKEWRAFEQWPVAESKKSKLYLHENGKLRIDEAPEIPESTSEYISDPAKPVPYSEDIKVVFTPRKFMTDDQRFAGRRPDVLVFQTDILEEDITLGGELLAKLKVATTGTDADWIVKLIDVHPSDHENYPNNPPHIKMGDYEMLVRSEVIRGRYRNSFSVPEPFIPNEITAIDLRLQDVLHTFKKGHRIMIQIQSTWFPYIDRNPQKYVDNIFYAKEEDFIKATHTIFHEKDNPTYLEVEILED